MEQLVRTGLLFDFYGGLLTEKQRKTLELYFLEDWSLAEIAAETDVSRQAVYDILHRSERLMEEYEAKLGLMQRFANQQKELQTVSQKLAALMRANESSGELVRELSNLRNIVEKLLENE